MSAPIKIPASPSVATKMEREPYPIRDEGIHVQLTYKCLNVLSIMKLVKRDDAGAVVFFTGTTRAKVGNNQVEYLRYVAYDALALRTMFNIAKEMKEKHELSAIAIFHRLGEVDVGDEGIMIAVSSPHRQAAWKAGEETLELVKQRAEIWKFESHSGGGEWRENKDSKADPEEEATKKVEETAKEAEPATQNELRKELTQALDVVAVES